MEDEGIVKKSKIFFTVFFVILIICLIIYFVFGKDKNLNPINPDNPDIPDNPDEVIINENGVYGLFVNLEDTNSYLRYEEDGTFKFILNVCEGYITYNNDNSIILKEITLINNEYNIELTIVPNSSKDINKIVFKGNLVSATGVVDTYDGPNSCSVSNQYKRA